MSNGKPVPPRDLFRTASLSDLCGERLVDETTATLLRERFVVPPFSVLSTADGNWQRRKQAWIDLGIKSELGRGDYIKVADQNDPEIRYWVDFSKGGPTPKGVMSVCQPKTIGEKYGRKLMPTVSIFDPVLCEVIYRWFCPPGGHVLDPFAGGSVRGIVACYLGLDYTGVDLNKLQINENRKQASEILKGGKIPTWHVGDSTNIRQIAPGNYDLVFSCPPYFDLEVYSTHPKDISNMKFPDFLAAYRRIISESVGMLRPNRFCAWVVSEVRDKRTGAYVKLVPETIRAFEDAGAVYYNEMVLRTAIGTLPVRAPLHIQKTRKVGRNHQTVLVFYKGDIAKIAQVFGDVW